MTEEIEDSALTKNKKINKNAKKKMRNKLKRNKQRLNDSKNSAEENETSKHLEIDYIPESLEQLQCTEEFSSIIEKFGFSYTKIEQTNSEIDQGESGANLRGPKLFTEDEENGSASKNQSVSKKQRKKLMRLNVFQLKELVSRPEVVEVHDVNSPDPKFLIALKGLRNSVPVPRHWCSKRMYLQGKIGFEKPPFKLPDFIKATGIMEMRQALQEKEDEKSLKSKMRERVRPKMGRIDIDYQTLHDAFFKWQTKPDLTIHGDLYYEKKELENRFKNRKPGQLSEALREALGMPVGSGAEKYPPPWLVAQQRFGPPPSYPNLKIPGLTAPIPEGCSFGYHPGGWGKPPVDERGIPLYGDVFGTLTGDGGNCHYEEVDKNLWGEFDSESEDEMEENEKQDEEKLEEETVCEEPVEAGLATPSGFSSVATTNFETAESIELRKKRIEDSMDDNKEPQPLYRILPEKHTSLGTALMGSTHIYDVSTAAVSSTKKSISGEGVELALNPEELDMDADAMKDKYDKSVKESHNQNFEDFSDMVAEHQAKKRKKQTQTSKSGGTKKFKF